MSDWDEALLAAKNPMQDDCGVLSHKKQTCLINALKAGQAAEVALERAIEILAADDHDCPSVNTCIKGQKGSLDMCTDCWRDYLMEAK